MRRDAVAYNNRGIAYRAKGDNDSAIADYTKAIEINPKFARASTTAASPTVPRVTTTAPSPTTPRPSRSIQSYASAYHNRGLAYRAKGDNDHAIEDATKAIEIDPEFTSAYYNRGLAYHAKGDNDRAIADQTMAIGINPRHASAYHNRGLAYRAKGNNDRAIADQAKAIEINKEYADADAVPVNISKAPLSPASIEKTALSPGDAPSPPFTLVLKADLGAQQVIVLENGTVVHVWPISSGVQSYATPTGIFQPKSANRMWYSRQYNWTPMPYAVFFTRGVAFHGTNFTSRLGKSASHGCIRLATSNAAQLFDLVHKHGFAQTQIIVFGTAKHDAPAVSRRVPTARETPASNGLPGWAKALFNQ